MGQMQKTGWFLVVVLLLLAPPLWAREDEEEGEKASPETEYLPLQPKLIVNLAGRRHYLRAEVQLMIRGEENLERIRKHMPMIRHTLIMQFSNLPPEKMMEIGEREKLRARALHEIRKLLDRYSDSDGLKDIFFTEFLVQ